MPLKIICLYNPAINRIALPANKMVQNIFHIRFSIDELHRLTFNEIHAAAAARAFCMSLRILLQLHWLEFAGRADLFPFQRKSIKIPRRQKLAIKYTAVVAFVPGLCILHICPSVDYTDCTALNAPQLPTARRTQLNAVVSLSQFSYRHCNHQSFSGNIASFNASP